MPSEAELLRLSLAVYEAATEPELWPGFMKKYAEAISAEAAVLQIHDLDRRSSSIVQQFGISRPLARSYDEHYSQLNLWRNRGHKLYIAGNVNFDEEQCPRHVLEASEFYNDYLLRIGAAFSMGAVITRKASLAPTLTGLRSRHRGPFREAERSIARFLLPHVARAWAVYQNREILAAQDEVLSTFAAGIVVFNSDGVVIYTNRAAEEIIRLSDGLGFMNGKICAADRRTDTLLSRALEHALDPGRPPGPVAVAIPRPSNRRAYQVVMAPVCARAGMPGTGAAAAIAFITDPEHPALPDGELLIRLYGLTRRETALAMKLAEGRSVEQAAEELSMSYQTARTHLRRIFSKTQTSRQTELLLLMARLPPVAATL